MTRELLRTFVVLSMFLATQAVHAQEWGTLTGRFLVNGPTPPQQVIMPAAAAGAKLLDESLVVAPNGDLLDACVYLRTKNVAVAPSYAATANNVVTLEISLFRFNPHFVLLRTSQTLKLLNSEVVAQAPNLDVMLNSSWHPLLAPGASEVRKLSRAESVPIRVTNTSAPWMRAWILLLDTPYAALSAGNGKFIIKDLPAGAELEFQLWHEVPGHLKNVAFKGGVADQKGRFKITIKPGLNDLGDIIVPVGLLTP